MTQISPGALLDDLKARAEKAAESNDSEALLDTIDIFREHEGTFLAAAETSPEVTYEYFAERISLESSVGETLSDDVRNRGIVALCKSFISVMPQLLKSDTINWMGADGIYRQSSRSLRALIMDELQKKANDPEMDAKLRERQGDVDPRTMSRSALIGFLLREGKFSSRFIGYCDDIVSHWDAVKGPSIMAILSSEDDHDKDMKEFVDIIRNHKDAIKRG